MLLPKGLACSSLVLVVNLLLVPCEICQELRRMNHGETKKMKGSLLRRVSLLVPCKITVIGGENKKNYFKRYSIDQAEDIHVGYKGGG